MVVNGFGGNLGARNLIGVLPYAAFIASAEVGQPSRLCFVNRGNDLAKITIPIAIMVVREKIEPHRLLVFLVHRTAKRSGQTVTAVQCGFAQIGHNAVCLVS